MKLLPCLFCRSSNPAMRVTTQDFFVFCRGCGAQGPPSDCPRMAACLWNGRETKTVVVPRGKKYLTKQEIRAVRAKLNDLANYRTHQDIADEYGVSRSTITKIANHEHHRRIA